MPLKEILGRVLWCLVVPLFCFANYTWWCGWASLEGFASGIWLAPVIVATLGSIGLVTSTIWFEVLKR